MKSIKPATELTVTYDERGRRITTGLKISTKYQLENEVTGPQWTELRVIDGTPAQYLPWDCLKKTEGENDGK